MKITNMVKKLDRRLSITKKVVLLYVFLILIPACSLMYFYYHKTNRLIETEVTNSILQALNQAEINISYRLDNIRDLSNSIFINSKLHENLGNEDENILVQAAGSKELENIIRSAQTNADVLRVRLYVDDKKVYAQEHVNFFSMKELEGISWYKEVKEQNGRIFWVSTYHQAYIDRGSAFVISCARILKDPKKYDTQLGVLVIDIAESTIYNILSGINDSYSKNLLILDGEGRIISHANKQLIGKVLFDENDFKQLQEDPKGIFSIGSGDEKTYIIHKTMANTGWSIVASVPAILISEKNSSFSKVANAISIIIILSAFILAFFLIFALIATSMNRRIGHMIAIMKDGGVQSLDGKLNAKNGDLNLLEKNVDTMLQTMHSLMEESYRSRVNEREAQLKALQAQINPHFLYNTLDTINWMAIRINAEDISTMVDSLAKYFRLSLNKGRDIVSVVDEIDLARVYLDIQRKRFNESIHVEFDIKSEVGNYCMPKLILQPIIENAVLHGIQKKKERKGTIKIAAEKKGEAIAFTITDDGVGMNPDTISRILNPPVENGILDTSTGSYGLYNVKERITLFSGEGYGITIHSVVGKGTTIEISLKAVRNGITSAADKN